MLTNFCLAQQNLVPNPSFEEYSECPNSPGGVGDDELEKAIGWYKPNWATTDYCNSCAPTNSGVRVPNNWLGYQEAFHGSAYALLGIYFEADPTVSEYVQCNLLEPLKPCHIYNVRMWISLSDYSLRASNSISIRLDKEPIKKEGSEVFRGFELPPHIYSKQTIFDTTNWVLISGEFLAEGGEEYLTIGRFFDTTLYSNNNPPYELNPCDSCAAFAGIPAYYYVDSVSVIEKGITENEKITQPNVITANNDGLNDCWLPSKVCGENWTCTILNRWGNIVFEFAKDEPGWCGNNAGGDPLSEGVYYYNLSDSDSNNLGTGFIHLVR